MSHGRDEAPFGQRVLVEGRGGVEGKRGRALDLSVLKRLTGTGRHVFNLFLMN